MTLIRPLALCVTIAAAGTLLSASGPVVPPVGNVQLKRISARVHARGALGRVELERLHRRSL